MDIISAYVVPHSYIVAVLYSCSGMILLFSLLGIMNQDSKEQDQKIKSDGQQGHSKNGTGDSIGRDRASNKLGAYGSKGSEHWG